MRGAPVTCVVLVASLCVPSRVSGDVLPDGSEFSVNAYTTAEQGRPAVAVAADGSFIVVWDSEGQDSDGRSVHAQRFANSGVAKGTEFLVNTYTTSHQSRSAVAAL